jgi:hypothetical protein
MRVEPTGPSPILPKPVASTARTPSSAADPAAAPATDGAFAPSGDLSSLLAAVRQAPEVRPGAVEAAAAKLTTGELSAPQAATDSAKALLDSGDATAPQ